MLRNLFFLLIISYVSVKAITFENIFQVEKTITLKSGDTIIGGIPPISFQWWVTDKNGQNYFADIYTKQLLGFDMNGNINEIAISKGQGPGEILLPDCLSLMGDTLIVADPQLRKVQYYKTPYMKYISSFFILLTHTQPFKIKAHGGKLFMSVFKENFEQPGTGDLIAIYDDKGMFLKTFYPLKREVQGRIISYNILSNFIIVNDKLYAIQSATYGVDVFNLNGDFIKKIGNQPEYFNPPSSDIPSIHILENKNMAERKKIFKKYKNSFTPLVVLFNNDNMIFVGTEIKKDNLYKYEVFDLKGNILHSNIDIPYRFINKGKDGYFYFLSKNKYDDKEGLKIEILKCRLRKNYE